MGSRRGPIHLKYGLVPNRRGPHYTTEVRAIHHENHRLPLPTFVPPLVGISVGAPVLLSTKWWQPVVLNICNTIPRHHVCARQLPLFLCCTKLSGAALERDRRLLRCFAIIVLYRAATSIHCTLLMSLAVIVKEVHIIVLCRTAPAAAAALWRWRLILRNMYEFD